MTETRFEVHEIFDVGGRGPVVTGEILEGRVQSGMWVSLTGQTGASSWRIGAVEIVDCRLECRSDIGLVLLDSPGAEELRALLPGGAVLAVREVC